MTRPLEGVTVLDFTTLLPGPYATHVLNRAGARVVKVERPGGEDLRRYAPRVDDEAAIFQVLNEGKEILTIDLKTGDRAELDALVASCDVLIEQFRPGVMDRLGLGCEDVRRVNPAVIYCSISGYGQSGPLAGSAGHDLNYLAAAGLLSLTAEPSLPPALLADLGGGAFPAVAEILLALLRRDRSGQGARIDIAMARRVFGWVPTQLANSFAGEWPTAGREMTLGGSPRYQLYRASDGRFLAVAPLEDRFWERFCSLVELPTNAGTEMVAERIAEHPALHWEALLGGEDTCVNVVRTLQEAAEHPQFADLFTRKIRPGSPLPLLAVPDGGVPWDATEPSA